MIDAGDGGVEQITGAAVLRVKLRAKLATVAMGRAEFIQQHFEREHLLDRAQIARDGADLPPPAFLTRAAISLNASYQVTSSSLPPRRI